MQFIIGNILPISMALFSGAMLFWSFFGKRIRGIREVDCTAAMQLINHKNAVVLDVREDEEYKAGHILNSVHVPFGKLKERAGELEKYREQPVLAVCRTGFRSDSACGLLGKLGFAQVYMLAGGIMAWQKANLPLKK